MHTKYQSNLQDCLIKVQQLELKIDEVVKANESVIAAIKEEQDKTVEAVK